MKLIGLIRQPKRKNILKKFLIILGITVFLSFLFFIIDGIKERKIFISNKDKATKIVTFTPDSKIIKEKEIKFKYRRSPWLTQQFIEQKAVLSLVREKFWKRFLEANRYTEKEGTFFDFDIKRECRLPFLKQTKNYWEKTKIYCITLRPEPDGIMPSYPCRLFVIARKDFKIFDLEKLSEFNKFIREEKIWIDTPPKAIKYAILYIKLVLNYVDEDYVIAVVNSLDEFINRFILEKNDVIPRTGRVYYETLQEYIQYRPKKYQELLKYKDEIKSPQVIKETGDSYKIIMYAREILDLESPKEGLALQSGSHTYQIALIKLKFTVYKNGEIDLKKEYLVKRLRQWGISK